MKKNLLTIKHYSDTLQLYQSFRKEWLTDEDAQMLLRYFRANENIPGFYQYTLTLENGESLTHETLCADLTEYAKYRESKVVSHIPLTTEKFHHGS